MFLKILTSSVIISFASYLAAKKPELAGFLIAAPIASLLALVFSYLQYKDSAASITFAKSILVGVPLSCLFFLPFFFAAKYDYGFWISYGAGIILLIIGFFIHHFITSHL